MLRNLTPTRGRRRSSASSRSPPGRRSGSGSAGYRDDSRPADAIVVLGAAQWNGVPSPLFQRRLDHAIQLYRDGLAPVLIVTGGKGRELDITTEAEAAKAYAIAHGVPEAAILAEDRGTNTLESLRGVEPILRDHGLHSAVLVSNRTHMLRSLRMAHDLGIEAYGSPTTTTSPAESSLVEQVEDTLHEIGGLALYFLTGTGSLSAAPAAAHPRRDDRFLPLGCGSFSTYTAENPSSRDRSGSAGRRPNAIQCPCETLPRDGERDT